MKNTEDIRWLQRFANYRKALRQLDEFMALEPMSKFEEQGLIKAFEYTYELAWNTLKDFLSYQGLQEITGSRDAIRKAFSVGLIENGETWMKMLEGRNRTSHTYNEITAKEIANDIKATYYPLFGKLEKTLLKRTEQEMES
jgi:nucleotidyltransferase substrate binding protein (TIGR01987 family)